MKPVLFAISLLSAFLPAIGWSAPDPYERSVDLIDRLYLYPDRLDAYSLGVSSAQYAARTVPWLIVETQAPMISLHHHQFGVLGGVTIDDMESLPNALLAMERLVIQSGYDISDIDIRYSLLQGLTDDLDRHSTILHGQKLTAFDARIKGTLVGIGAVLSLIEEQIVVMETLRDGPAKEAGLLKGDILLRIDGRSLVNMPLKEAVRYLRGEENTEVELEIQRGEERLSFQLLRREVILPNVIARVIDDTFAYAKISYVSKKTVTNLTEALAQFSDQGVLDKGLILDLRGNTGGSMKESARAADLFLSEGTLLRTVGKNGTRVENLQARMESQDDPTDLEMPLVILVDDRSASGAEILAGSLLELNRAVLVGQNTYGKGTVQKIYPLDPDTKLKLTIAQYLLAHDRTISELGLTPDVTIGSIRIDPFGIHLSGAHGQGPLWKTGALIPAIELSYIDSPLSYVEDVPLELAKRALDTTTSSDRTDLLAALRAGAKALKEETDPSIQQLFADQAINWDLPVALETEGFLNANGQVSIRSLPDQENTIELTAMVQNEDEAAIAQAYIELLCPTNSLFNNRLIPVGWVEPGETVTGNIQIPLRPGIAPREDKVTVTLHSLNRPALILGTSQLKVASSEVPSVHVDAHLNEGPHGTEACITVYNHSEESLQGVEVSFSSPQSPHVELLDYASRIPEVGANEGRNTILHLQVEKGVASTIPLELVVETDHYGKLLSWPLPLQTDGTTTTLSEPRIQLNNLPTSAPAGRHMLPILVHDQTLLRHVIVYIGDKKHPYLTTDDYEFSMEIEADLSVGQNPIRVIAENQYGIQNTQVAYIWGTQPPSLPIDATDVPADIKPELP